MKSWTATGILLLSARARTIAAIRSDKHFVFRNKKRIEEHGKPLQEEGQVTVVLQRKATGWKMRG